MVWSSGVLSWIISHTYQTLKENYVLLYVNLQRYDGDAIFVSTYAKVCCHPIAIATSATFGWRNKMHRNIIWENWNLQEKRWVKWSPQVLSGNHAKFDVENDIIYTSDASAGSRAHHYNDVIMGAIASQITSLTIGFSTVYSNTDQRKHQSSASLAFVRGLHRRPVNSPHKWPVTRKMFPFDDVIM